MFPDSSVLLTQPAVSRFTSEFVLCPYLLSGLLMNGLPRLFLFPHNLDTDQRDVRANFTTTPCLPFRRTLAESIIPVPDQRYYVFIMLICSSAKTLNIHCA